VPFIAATVVAILLGAFAPTGDVAVVVYIAAGLAFVVWLQSLLAKRQSVVIDPDPKKPGQQQSE